MDQILRWLDLKPGAVVLDATVGCGGHAEKILEAIGPTGYLIGLDRDREALDYAARRLIRFKDQMTLIHASFGQLAALLSQRTMLLDAELFDLGVSSLQLETAQRGFSFSLDGPLDMRMDQTEGQSASEIVNRGSVVELAHLLRAFGQERWAGRVARAIVRARPLTTTTHLANVIRQAIPAPARHRRIDAATRCFQAIRIAVNQELDLLPQGLAQGIEFLKPGGRIAVLAYHSLEDRIVKMTFREYAQRGMCEVLTRKPIRPSEKEVAQNRRARSACSRIAQRLTDPSCRERGKVSPP